MVLCTQTDLELALGGASQLVQLLDKDADGIADKPLVDRAIVAGSSELASYLVNIDLTTVNQAYQMVLVTKSADMAAFEAWKIGAYGQGIPEAIKEGHEAAIRWAKEVAGKTATLGEPDKPGLEELIGTVDHDPTGIKMSIAALKRGFR